MRQAVLQVQCTISIHALREEGDWQASASCGRHHGISIHALREEGDRSKQAQRGCGCRFLSTPSARRATRASRRPKSALKNFYPRPPRGGRRICNRFASRSLLFLSTPSARRATTNSFKTASSMSISIHALREEGDPEAPGRIREAAKHFYPRPPRGGRRMQG